MHMVMFTSAEGKAATHQTEGLEEAVKFVEHIRNSEGVSDARLYRLTEIPMEVKAYYKVELGTSAAAPLVTPATLVTEERAEPTNSAVSGTV